MGYWHEHPLAGDDPEDSILTLVASLGCEDRYDPQFKSRLESACSSVEGLHELKGMLEENQWFVIPFLLVVMRIRIDDPTAVEMLQSLIGDGGAEFRGYTSGDESVLSRSPRHYAKQLASLWVGVMSGTVPFEKLTRVPSLIETLDQRIIEDELDSHWIGDRFIGRDD